MDQRTPIRRTAPAAALLCALITLATACTAVTAVTSGVEGKPGAAGLRDPYFPRLGNGGYDVTHYGLDLDVDVRPDRDELRGTATITARATQDLSAFNLDLTGLDVTSATVEGRPAAVNRAGDELTLRPDDDVEDHLRKGRTFRTVIRYSGSPETVVDRDLSKEGWLKTADGSLALGQPTGSMAWFPGNHHPSDKAAYDIAVTVPKGLTAVSNGEQVSRRTAGDRTTFRWRTAEPLASYLATVAIGRYTTKSTTTPEGLAVFTAVDPTVARGSASALARIPEVMTWAAGRFGPYPFSSTGAIIERRGDAGYALETQNRPVFPGPPSTGLLVHELAHQWFGDSVTPETWQDMWLNEGFATYAEWLWAEDKEDTPTRVSFDAAFLDDDNWAFPPADPPGAAELSRAPVYGRGAMVLEKLRQTVDDDKAFFALLKGWAREHRHANASTDDFTAYAEQRTGRDLGELWETWLYGDGRPDDPDAPATS